MGNLDGKVALVTGAARRNGMGRAFAVRLAREGADVVVAGRHQSPEEFPEWEKREGWRGLDSVVAEIETLGRQALAIEVDVSNSKEVSEMVNKALAKFGKIDILVNNAGLHTIEVRYVPILNVEEEAWDRHMAVNLKGVFLCCKAVGKTMVEREEGGKIINIASIFGKMGVAGAGTYSTSKFGVIGLTQNLALELAPYKINVNAVCPGTITTDMAKDYFGLESQRRGIPIEEVKQDYFTSLADLTALKRPAIPEEVADLVAFLASSEADFITGQSINIDGGRLMAH